MKTLFCFATLMFVSAISVAQTVPADWCQKLPRPEYAKLERANVRSDWFEVYRIRPGVFAIYEPHQFQEVISYLIIGNQRALLFDTGMGISKISDVVSQLTKRPVIVLNSHSHFDHTGGNAEFRDILGMDTKFTRAQAKGTADPDLRQKYAQEELAPDHLCGPLPSGVAMSSYSIRPFQISRHVHDGERIALGGRELEVIFTPGHTPDALCLLDRAHGLLFTGDTFYSGPIYLFEPETDFAAYARSVQRLAKLEPKLSLLLPAHNVPVAEPGFLLRLAQAVQNVQAGKAKPSVTNGFREYPFQGFSLLFAAH